MEAKKYQKIVDKHIPKEDKQFISSILNGRVNRLAR